MILALWLGCGSPEHATPESTELSEVDLEPWLAELDRVSDTVEERPTGPLRRLEVQSATDPRADAEALAATLPQGVETYVTSENDLDADLRIYQGKRQTHHLTFRPRLEAPEAHRGLDRPLVAVLIEGLGRDAQAGQAVLEAPLPLSVAVRPFSPFGLLHARDAALEHKELLVDLGPEDPVPLALESLPWSTGVLLHEHRSFESGALHEYYLVDASGDSLARQGVPMLGVGERVTGDVGPWTVRIENLADRNGAVLVLVSLDDREAVRSTLRWLYESQDRLRAVFVSELLDWQRLSGSPPG